MKNYDFKSLITVIIGSILSGVILGWITRSVISGIVLGLLFLIWHFLSWLGNNFDWVGSGFEPTDLFIDIKYTAIQTVL